MNRKEKGELSEQRSKDILVRLGYKVVKSEYSRSPFDLYGFKGDELLMVQVRTRNYPSDKEVAAMLDFPEPKRIVKEVHLWRDYPYPRKLYVSKLLAERNDRREKRKYRELWHYVDYFTRARLTLLGDEAEDDLE
jgi:hypothetical protein